MKSDLLLFYCLSKDVFEFVYLVVWFVVNEWRFNGCMCI